MDARRLVLLGAPVAFGVASFLHPRSRGPSIAGALEPSLARWLAIHVVRLLLLGLPAATLWLLVEECRTRAATVSRLAPVPFLAFYGGFDAVVGIATGTRVRFAGGLEGEGRAAAVALRQAGANWAVVLPVALAGLLFAIDHPFPTGTAAMACLSAAAWLRARRPA